MRSGPPSRCRCTRLGRAQPYRHRDLYQGALPRVLSRVLDGYNHVFHDHRRRPRDRGVGHRHGGARDDCLPAIANSVTMVPNNNIPRVSSNVDADEDRPKRLQRHGGPPCRQCAGPGRFRPRPVSVHAAAFIIPARRASAAVMSTSTRRRRGDVPRHRGGGLILLLDTAGIARRRAAAFAPAMMIADEPAAIDPHRHRDRRRGRSGRRLDRFHAPFAASFHALRPAPVVLAVLPAGRQLPARLLSLHLDARCAGRDHAAAAQRRLCLRARQFWRASSCSTSSAAQSLTRAMVLQASGVPLSATGRGDLPGASPRARDDRGRRRGLGAGAVRLVRLRAA